MGSFDFCFKNVMGVSRMLWVLDISWLCWLGNQKVDKRSISLSSIGLCPLHFFFLPFVNIYLPRCW